MLIKKKIGVEFLNFESGVVQGNHHTLIDTENFNNSKVELPYYYFGKNYSHETVEFYTKFIQRFNDKKAGLKECLKTLLPLLLSIDISLDENDSPILMTSQSNRNVAVPLTFLGDGAKKLFGILSLIIANPNERVMIDELDNGIHYSRLNDFWKTIIKAAIDNDVQLFITTHSKECLQYFKEALEETELEKYQKDARLFLLKKDKGGDTFAKTISFEGLAHSLDYDNEPRD